jgi:hypothetical protein
MSAVSELEVPIVHRDRTDEDAMFATAKQCKGQGMKPEEAAISYFLTEAERGVATDPDKWLAMARQAYQRVEIWLNLKKIGPQYADMVFAFLRDSEADEA